MDIKTIISNSNLSAEQRSLLELVRSSQSPVQESEQAKTLLQIGMIERLIMALNKNSESSDKLAGRLNVLTLAIAVATCIGAIATIVQIFK